MLSQTTLGVINHLFFILNYSTLLLCSDNEKSVHADFHLNMDEKVQIEEQQKQVSEK